MDEVRPVSPIDDDDDIPIVDRSGAKRVLKGSSIVDLGNLTSSLPTATAPVGGQGQVMSASSAAAVSAEPSSAVGSALAPDDSQQAPLASAAQAEVKPVPASPSATPPADFEVVTKGDFVPGQKIRATPAQLVTDGRAETVAAPVPAKSATVEDDVWDKMADEAAGASGIVLDADRKNRFRRLAAMYFRDLRDELETVSKLTMTVASGGLGLNDDEAGRVMGFLREKNVAAHAAAAARTVEEKAKFTAGRAAKVMGETEEREQREQEGLDRLYSRLTEKLTKPHANHLPAVPVSGQPLRSGVSNGQAAVPPPAAPRVIPVTVEGKPASGAGTTPPAALTTAMTIPPEKALVNRGASGQATESPTATGGAAITSVPKTIDDAHLLPAPADGSAITAPKAPSTKPTSAVSPSARNRPAAPASSAARPSVTDVIAPPRLVGPVEELRQLAVADFRRLSRDPREACLKIRDKIDLLADRSFAERDRGVKAWQESVVNRLYLDILRLSLEGKPVPEVIDIRQKNGEPILSKAEFDAVMDLNRKLRFG